MKKNFGVVLAGMVSLNLLAQPVSNPPPSPAIQTAPGISAGTTNETSKTNAPTARPGKKKAAKKAEKKSTVRKRELELRTVPLVAGNAIVVASNVNVRGQAKLNSEVITKLNKGDQVAVLEEVLLKKSGPDEPSAWAHIILPARTHVWINAQFIDPATKTVKPSKLKIRGGPGENYSTLGILKKGDVVTEVGTKGDWIEIEAPAEASAFVAAQYLKQEEAPTVVASTTPAAPTNEPPTTTATVTEPPTIAPPPGTPTAATPPPDQTTNTAATTPETIEPKLDEPPPKRIVQREGMVRSTFSIQAPTRYELISPDNRKAINYLYTKSPDLDLSRYKGLRIVVTGEEGLDERWKNTPVITIQRIQVLE